ncbi:MAG TPA: hypothetical protein VEK08_10005 [Planctomycetota bacterium]|nr:hypothetical protein [Planctomycetota bacterium]
MIVALVILDRLAANLQDKPSYFSELAPGKSVIEQVVSTVVRGPFAGTVVASLVEYFDRAQEHLHGFAIHPLKVANPKAGVHAPIIDGLNFADSFRERWEKARAAASARFTDDEDDEDDEEAPAPISGRKSNGTHRGAKKKADWAKHRDSKDVKLRGLARSFDRNGVILFRGDRPAITVNLQAQIVEAFGREGADKGPKARSFAQAVHNGVRGYPVLMSFEAAREVAALPAATKFDDWLLQNIQRVQDVNTDEWGAVAEVRDSESLAQIAERLRSRQS